jgi:hypothetical protein
MSGHPFCPRQQFNLGQNHPRKDFYQQYFLGKHYLPHPHSPSPDASPPGGLKKDTILQEKKKKILLPYLQLDFSGRHSCFKTLRHMTSDPPPGTNGSRVSFP